MIDNIHINRFELTQRCGHLYWIPLFPMGLQWHARARDGKLYTINAGLEQQLKDIPYSRFSLLFAFAWPILILACMGFYQLNKAYNDYKWKTFNSEIQQKVMNAKQNAIMHPTDGDYYHFLGARDQYAKLIGVNDTALLLSPALKEPAANEAAEIQGLFTDSTHLPQVWVNKLTLLRMADNKSDFDTALFGPGALYLVEIERF